MRLKLVSPFVPAGDQPSAIRQLSEGVLNGEKEQILLGVTGSGKTFTMANVIEKVQKPTLIITHNKTLVTQLYGEFRQFFPDNAVECFVSYYDYYQPEAYIASSNTYIEKDLSINEDLDKLRLSSISKILSGRRDVIIVASVSCIYGAGNPREYENRIIRIHQGLVISRNKFLELLIHSLYVRTTADLLRGHFRVVGNTIDINLPYLDYAYRIVFWGDTIESIHMLDIDTGMTKEALTHAAIFPSNIYLAPKEYLPEIVAEIQEELQQQCAYFENMGKKEEAHRLQQRVNYDMEMIRELGYCSGVENYSRFFDRREKGTRPFCLIDYFPKDFLCIIDESHQTIPQISGMYGGDRSRKLNLVAYGFRLPSALDNRPLNFYEFESLVDQIIYVSATPAAYELKKTGGVVVEQIVRPTGLLDPPVEVRPTKNQIDDLLHEIHLRIEKKERVLVTTLTKKMAEELYNFLLNISVNAMYIHSDIDTLERVEILRALRLGKIDVLIGVNLLREGLDLPEVSLVAILDADKEGFLRNQKSLTQTIGRAARNSNGNAIFYADTITESIRRTIEETNRRREKQMQYNKKYNIIPKTILKSTEEILGQTSVLLVKDTHALAPVPKKQPIRKEIYNKNIPEYNTPEDLQKRINTTMKKIKSAAKRMDFLEAARLRDELSDLQKKH